MLDQSGNDRDELVELTAAPTEAQAAIIQSVLADAGIESCTQKAPGFDYLGLGTFGFTVTSIAVRKGDLESARAVLSRNRQDSVDLDWSEVDVGEPEDQVSAEIAGRDEVSGNRSRRNAGWWAVAFYFIPPAVAVAGIYLLVRAR